MKLRLRHFGLPVILTVISTFVLTLSFALGEDLPLQKDFSTPTKVQGRMILFDPDKKAVWLNLAAQNENTTTGPWYFPGVNLEFYPEDETVWQSLKQLGTCCPPPGQEDKIPPAEQAPLIEVLVQEVAKDTLVIKSVKEISSRTEIPTIPLPYAQKVIRESSANSEKLIVQQGPSKRALTITKIPNGYDLSYALMSPEGGTRQSTIQVENRSALREKIRRFLSRNFDPNFIEGD